MDDSRFPKYVKMGRIVIILDGVEGEVATYSRLAGAWEINARWRNGSLVTQDGLYNHMNDITLVPATVEEHDADNAGHL